MHWSQILGIALISLPFVGVAVPMVRTIGLADTLVVFAMTVAVIAALAVGLPLAAGALA